MSNNVNQNYNNITMGMLARVLDLNCKLKTPVAIWGMPGIGKTTSVAEFAKRMNYAFLPISLVARDSSDIGGLPFKCKLAYTDVDTFNYCPSQLFPLVEFGQEGVKQNFLKKKDKYGNPILSANGEQDYYDGMVVLLDEFTSVSNLDMLSATYELLHNRRIGNYHLSDNVIVILAGNRHEDRAITNSLGTAIENRVKHFHVTFDEEYQMNVAKNNNWSKLVIEYLRFRKNWLTNTNPDKHIELTAITTPRSWEAVSDFVKSEEFTKSIKEMVKLQKEGDSKNQKVYSTIQEISSALLASIQASIEPTVANEFFDFLKYRHNLPDLDELEQNIETYKLPDSSEIMNAYATAVYVAEASVKNAKFLIYLSRLAKTGNNIFKDIVNIALGNAIDDNEGIVHLAQARLIIDDLDKVKKMALTQKQVA